MSAAGAFGATSSATGSWISGWTVPPTWWLRSPPAELPLASQIPGDQTSDGDGGRGCVVPSPQVGVVRAHVDHVHDGGPPVTRGEQPAHDGGGDRGPDVDPVPRYRPSVPRPIAHTPASRHAGNKRKRPQQLLLEDRTH